MQGIRGVISTLTNDGQEVMGQEIDAVRHYIAMLMAEHGLVSAPNMAIGEAFHIGAPVQATVPVAGIAGDAQQPGG